MKHWLPCAVVLQGLVRQNPGSHKLRSICGVAPIRSQRMVAEKNIASASSTCPPRFESVLAPQPSQLAVGHPSEDITSQWGMSSTQTYHVLKQETYVE